VFVALEPTAVPVEVEGGDVTLGLADEYPVDGAVAPLLAAIAEGLTGEPTDPGVAVGVDWNGLLFQNARLGLVQRPPV
jgi:hypothetical protein